MAINKAIAGMLGADELADLYLGHLGSDGGRRVRDRGDTSPVLMEVEVEMAVYLVAMRNGLKPRSESYLANYKGAFEDLNLYAVCIHHNSPVNLARAFAAGVASLSEAETRAELIDSVLKAASWDVMMTLNKDQGGGETG